MWRKLSAEEELSFRAWARGNYTPLTPIDGTWHPVIQRECVTMNVETGPQWLAAMEARVGEILTSEPG